MRRSIAWLVPSFLLAACGGSADRPAADTDTAPADAATGGPRAVVTVLYQRPADTAAFEAYYPKHLEIVSAHQEEIGFTSAELTKFVSALDGSTPAFYRQAELYFPSLEAARKGMATEGFRKVGDDFKNFDTKGLIGMVAVETGDPSPESCPALVTVIYNMPKDTAAFEAYYPKHLDIVSQGQQEIGFVRADLTRFVSSLDGSAPARYRQAELCFESMDALKKGVATPAFKRVGDDLANFATGGLDGLIGEQQ